MNYGRLFLLSILLSLLASCYSESDKKPEFDEKKIIPKEKMIEVLTDIHLVEGIIATTQREGVKKETYVTSYTNAVLEKHDIGIGEFEESIRYYTYHIEELDNIYEEVIIRLSKKESEVMNPSAD